VWQFVARYTEGDSLFSDGLSFSSPLQKIVIYFLSNFFLIITEFRDQKYRKFEFGPQFSICLFAMTTISAFYISFIF